MLLLAMSLTIVSVSAISPECEAYLRNVAFEYSSFDVCALLRARPFSVCTRCYTDYSKAYNTYLRLRDGTGASQKNCSDDLLSGDRVSIINRDFEHLTATWSSANCDSCLVSTTTKEGISYTVAKTTTQFEELARALKECIDEQLNDSPKICDACTGHYKNLSSFYSSLDETYSGGICMDILDNMNSTRVEWGRYKCSKVYRLDIDFFCYATTLLIFTVVFYVATRFSQVAKSSTIIEGRSMRDHMFKFGQSHSSRVGRSNARIGAFGIPTSLQDDGALIPDMEEDTMTVEATIHSSVDLEGRAIN